MPNDFTREEGELVGQIRPAPDDGKPLFRVIGRREPVRHTGDENVRPCDHKRFTLDRRWSTVTCSDCKEKVDPFAAMMRYVSWWEDMQRERQNLDHATRRFHVGRLKDMRDRRALTNDERLAISDAIQRQHSMPVTEIEKLADRIRKTLSERKNAARAARMRA